MNLSSGDAAKFTITAANMSTYADKLTPGQQALLKAYPDTPLTGTVLRIGPQATGLVGDAATFPVILELDTAALDLRPGMTGRAEISGGR